MSVQLHFVWLSLVLVTYRCGLKTILIWLLIYVFDTFGVVIYVKDILLVGSNAYRHAYILVHENFC